jgi:8-oxo-dGTP diphosphatase
MRIPQDVYDVVVRSMPIPCVDVVPVSADGQVLLVRRRKEPAAGHWWFPGGRVHHGERRDAAARRKLLEECGLDAVGLEQGATFELFFAGDPPVHGITTVYVALVAALEAPTLDAHSADARWRPAAAWLADALHPFVRSRLEEVAGTRMPVPADGPPPAARRASA